MVEKMSMITIYDSDGFYTQSYDLEDGDTPIIPVGGGYIAGDYDGEQFYHSGGVPTARPTVTDEEFYFIHSDNSDTLSISLPSGTLVTDLETNTVYTAGASESFQFRSQINGEWEFMIEPPFPYKTVTITVSANAY